MTSFHRTTCCHHSKACSSMGCPANAHKRKEPRTRPRQRSIYDSRLPVRYSLHTGAPLAKPKLHHRRLDFDVSAVLVNDVGFAAEAVCNFEIRIALVRQPIRRSNPNLCSARPILATHRTINCAAVKMTVYTVNSFRPDVLYILEHLANFLREIGAAI